MKTISQYLDQIPDKDVRERAKRNCKYPDEAAGSVLEALRDAFPWCNSPEGHDYWTSIYVELRDFAPPLTQLQRARREIKRLYRGQRTRMRHKRRVLRPHLPAGQDNAGKWPQNALNGYCSFCGYIACDPACPNSTD